MEKENRFELLYRRIGRHKLAVIVGIVFSALFLEVAAFAFYCYKAHQNEFPTRSLRTFFLARILYPSIFPREPQLAGQRYLGVVTAWDPFDAVKLFTADSLLGWRPARNIAALYSQGPPGDREYLLITNDQGFYSIGDASFYYAPEKPPDTYRAIVIGGSTVMGQGAFLPDENLPSQIKRSLEPILGQSRKLEVINAGVDAYTSGQELLYLQSELIQFHPDLVIAYDGWNDLWFNNGLVEQYGDRWIPLKTAHHYANEDLVNRAFPVLGALRIFLKQTAIHVAHTAYWSFASTRILMSIGKSALSFLEGRGTQNARTSNPYHDESVRVYGENHEQMIALAHLYHFNLAWFMQPLMDVDGRRLIPEELKIHDEARGLNDGPELRTSFYRDARRMMEELRGKYRDQENICIADLSLSLRGIEERVYEDSGHLLPRGNQQVAERMLFELTRCGLIH